jgi:hypothetical protein
MGYYTQLSVTDRRRLYVRIASILLLPKLPQNKYVNCIVASLLLLPKEGSKNGGNTYGFIFKNTALPLSPR